MTFKSPLSPTWDVPAEIRARFGEKLGRQRAMAAEGHLLLILHAAPRADENERQGRLYWRKPGGEWQSSETAGGAHTLARHIDEYAKRLEAIDRSLDGSELAADYFAVMSQLAPLVRSARNLHKTLQEAREFVPADAELITLRDRAYEMERFAELLYEDAKNGLEFAVARRAEEQTEAGHRMAASAHRLNLMAAFFFPLATLSTIFGANLVHGLENYQAPWTFLSFVAVGILLGIVLTIFVSSNLPRLEKRVPQKTLYERRP
jgi:hypothetical protein